MNRAYKYRIYPNAEQEQLLTDTFRSCRFVYNHYLALRSEKHQQATVSREGDGSYYVSVLYEYQAVIVPQAVRPEQVIGLDYKSDGLYMDSEGTCCGMPH